MSDDYSTPRVERHRGHFAGDHSDCLPNGKCSIAREAHYKREKGLRAKAILDECAAQGLNPEDYLDDVGEALADVAALEGEQPDVVSKLAARAEIKCRGKIR